jgi:hypothetical protein
MLRRVVWKEFTKVLEESTVSIFRIDEYAKQANSKHAARLVYLSTRKMEAVLSSATSVTLQSTRFNISKHNALHISIQTALFWV